MQRKKFPFLVTPPHILPPVKPSMLRYWIFDWKIFGKNTFYKICSKHGPDAKKNYFVFSIIDGGGESKPQWWKFHHLFFFFYSAPSLNVGGSLMNIGNKQVGIKKLASSGNIEKAIAKSHHLFSVGYKLDKVGGKAKKSLSSLKLVGFIYRLNF